MEQIQVIRGFSDIKIQLIKKCNLNKAPKELELWFTEDEHATYVHDNEDHYVNMLIALKINQKWISRLEPTSPGEQLLNNVIANKAHIENLSGELNFRYKLFGFIRNRF